MVLKFDEIIGYLIDFIFAIQSIIIFYRIKGKIIMQIGQKHHNKEDIYRFTQKTLTTQKLAAFYSIHRIKILASSFKNMVVEAIKTTNPPTNNHLIHYEAVVNDPTTSNQTPTNLTTNKGLHYNFHKSLEAHQQRYKNQLAKSYSLKLKYFNGSNRPASLNYKQNIKESLKSIEKRLKSKSISEKSDKSNKGEIIKQISQRLVNSPRLQIHFQNNYSNLGNISTRVSRLQTFLKKIKNQRVQHQKGKIMVKEKNDKIYMDKNNKQTLKGKDHNIFIKQADIYQTSPNSKDNTKYKNILSNLQDFKKDLKELRNTNEKILSNSFHQNIPTVNNPRRYSLPKENNENHSFAQNKTFHIQNHFSKEKDLIRSSPVQYFNQISEKIVNIPIFMEPGNANFGHKTLTNRKMQIGQENLKFRENKTNVIHFGQKPKIKFVTTNGHVQHVAIFSINKKD